MSYSKQGASKIVKAIGADIMEDELNRVISEIVNTLVRRDREIELLIQVAQGMPETLDKYATLSELKIKRQEIKSLKLSVYTVLRRSTNKLLIAAIDGTGN